MTVLGNRLENPGLAATSSAISLGVAGEDDDHRVAPVLDVLHDGVDRLPSEVLLAASHQRVGLVDQEDAAVGVLEHLGDLGGGLADEPGDESAAIDLGQVPDLDQVEAAVDASQQAGHGGLAGARVAAEDQVLVGVDDGKATVGSELLDPEQGGEQPDLFLHRVESDQPVEFGQDVFDGFGRDRFAFGCGFRLGGGLDRLVGDRGGPRPARVEPGEELLLEGDDGRQFSLGGPFVERDHGVGQGHDLVVVEASVGGAAEPVDVAQGGEQRGGLVEPRRPPVEDGALAQLGGHRIAGEEIVGCERCDERPQFVVGVASVGVDERAAEVEGLDDGVVAEPFGVDRGAGGRVGEGIADLPSELVDCSVQAPVHSSPMLLGNEPRSGMTATLGHVPTGIACRFILTGWSRVLVGCSP